MASLVPASPAAVVPAAACDVPDSASSPLASRASLLGDGSGIKRVLLFDVDGTLVRSGSASNTVHKDAFGWAIAAAFPAIPDAHISEVPHHGQTDAWILRLMLRKRGVADADIDAQILHMQALMCEYCAAREASIGVQVLPGVSALLAALAARPDTLLGLVTGNLQPICMMKLRRSGLGGMFSLGGFGSDHVLRGELIRIALTRAREAYPGLDVAAATVVHVGDTPNDLAAAAYAGVRGVGVATGIMSVAELVAAAAECGPAFRHIVVPGLEDASALADIFGITEGETEAKGGRTGGAGTGEAP
jgi:phosphoglycolate phosphatase